ncbi:acyltransferase [Pseudomonas extremaustralis]|uniref:Maltose O-acetyltransferase n=1 Tax=Pseudomonas extremaustralis TaxID=359110 RepID=A0ABY0N891_9PSED|nr:acyltransferase [Pseudomonas extremaustralis]MDG2969570.1 acyltransferase [Pseudomonas extremaustralis]SDF11755.1 maltose O-acetyltransferase [Pseudomonas extremaustralis]SKA93168.1 maltose O-acetyltransferase [Pseudomonas extremaustralis]
MLINDLIRHRLKVNPLTLDGLKYLAKRVLLLGRLLKANTRQRALRRQGATLGSLVMLNDVEFEGGVARFSIGTGSFIGKRTFIQLHAPVRIGAHVAINDGVRILTGSHGLDDPAWRLKVAPVAIGDYAWIATGAMILPGVTIGEGAVVGAGSVVNRDVEPFTVVAGNPARVVRLRAARTFTYSPVRSSAIVEAWMGK